RGKRGRTAPGPWETCSNRSQPREPRTVLRPFCDKPRGLQGVGREKERERPVSCGGAIWPKQSSGDSTFLFRTNLDSKHYRQLEGLNWFALLISSLPPRLSPLACLARPRLQKARAYWGSSRIASL